MPARRKPSSDALPVRKTTALTKSTTLTGTNPVLVTDLRQIILNAREQVARAVDSGLVLLYWSIGQRIRTDVLNEKRAEYGEKILHAVSTKLVVEFGQGYSARNLANMIRFTEVFPDIQIVSALGRQLSWTHFRSIIYLDDSLKRDFYAEMCRIEMWNTRTLRDKIDSMLFERTALSKKPAKLAEMELAKLRDEDRMTPDLVFRDPYVLGSRHGKRWRPRLLILDRCPSQRPSPEKTPRSRRHGPSHDRGTKLSMQKPDLNFLSPHLLSPITRSRPSKHATK